MKYFIATESGNYADEFDLEKMQLIEADNREDALKSIFSDILDDEDEDNANPWPKEFYFGTNEAIQYADEEELFDSIILEEISEQEYNTIKKYLGTSFGTGAIL